MKKAIILLLLFSLIFTTACTPKEEEITEPPVEEEETPEEEDEAPEEPAFTNFSIFNGKGISDDQENYQAIGIMVENSPASRPHSGLGQADIVYEVAVETYTITRFMAIFASQHPSKIGPVRSARIPFVQMIQEWGTPFAYYGSAARGRGDAKSLIHSLNIPIRFDGHQGVNDEFYFRDNSRRSPHNAYFNGQVALNKIPELEYEKRFNFADESNVDQEDISSLTLGYSSTNQVKYQYDSENRNYLRYINNAPMMDEYTNEQISVNNIIVQHAPHIMVEADHYVLVDFIGEGKSEYFIDGKYEEGTWRKASYNDKTEYFGKYGSPIDLLAGNTWIQVVHRNVDIEME